MEEVNHFTHKDHPLKLMESWETIIYGGDDGKQGVVCILVQLEISFIWSLHSFHPFWVAEFIGSYFLVWCDRKINKNDYSSFGRR